MFGVSSNFDCFIEFEFFLNILEDLYLRSSNIEVKLKSEVDKVLVFFG
jgi:hypothetical protein